jgi:hypothetical protein
LKRHHLLVGFEEQIYPRNPALSNPATRQRAMFRLNAGITKRRTAAYPALEEPWVCGGRHREDMIVAGVLSVAGITVSITAGCVKRSRTRM